MTDIFEKYAAPLEETRTPNIVLRAIRNELEVVKEEPKFVRVSRHLNPVVPYTWLTHAWVLQYEHQKARV